MGPVLDPWVLDPHRPGARAGSALCPGGGRGKLVGRLGGQPCGVPWDEGQGTDAVRMWGQERGPLSWHR